MCLAIFWFEGRRTVCSANHLRGLLTVGLKVVVAYSYVVPQSCLAEGGHWPFTARFGHSMPFLASTCLVQVVSCLRAFRLGGESRMRVLQPARVAGRPVCLFKVGRGVAGQSLGRSASTVIVLPWGVSRAVCSRAARGPGAGRRSHGH